MFFFYYWDQACQTINTRHQCYRFDPACPRGNDDNKGISYGIPEGSQNIIIYSMISVILALIVTSIILAYLVWKKNKATTGMQSIIKAKCWSISLLAKWSIFFYLMWKHFFLDFETLTKSNDWANLSVALIRWLLSAYVS